MRKLLLLLFLFVSFLGFSQSAVTLAWNPSTDNVGVAGYCVWINGERHDSTINTQYDFDVFPAGEYWLTISAYDAAGNESAQSLPFHIIIDDITRPGIPEIITVEYQLKSARITWMEPIDNVGIVGYNIYLDGVFLQSTSSNRLELNDLTPEEVYRLSITAYDDAGNESAKSSEFIIRLPIDNLEMSIYPNPSNGVFTVKLENGTIQENTRIQIISLNGQIIFEHPIPEKMSMPYVEEINLSNIVSEGSYVVSLIENNIRTYSFRLIIVTNILYQSKNNRFAIKPYENQSIIIPISMISSPSENK